MAQALFITVNDLKKNTSISGNVDVTKLLPAIKTAQQLELEPILGTDLYEKLSNDIITGSLSGDYATLITNYIHDVLIHFAVSYYLPFATYQITNGGVSKWNGGDNYESIDTGEVSLMTNKEKSLGESYKSRLIKHLKNNTTKYPEYLTNSDATDIRPNGNTNRSGLYLN